MCTRVVDVAEEEWQSCAKNWHSSFPKDYWHLESRGPEYWPQVRDLDAKMCSILALLCEPRGVTSHVVLLSHL